MLVFALLWTLLSSAMTYVEYRSLTNVYRNQGYKVAEGWVENLTSTSYGKIVEECFTVSEQRFCYSDVAPTATFHQSAANGGPIRAGQPVRIAHHGGVILRVEIRADSLPFDAERSDRRKAGT